MGWVEKVLFSLIFQHKSRKTLKATTPEIPTMSPIQLLIRGGGSLRGTNENRRGYAQCYGPWLGERGRLMIQKKRSKLGSDTAKGKNHTPRDIHIPPPCQTNGRHAKKTCFYNCLSLRDQPPTLPPGRPCSVVLHPILRISIR